MLARVPAMPVRAAVTASLPSPCPPSAVGLFAAGRPGGRLRRGPVLPRALVPVLQRAARGFRPGGGDAHRARHQGRGAVGGRPGRGVRPGRPAAPAVSGRLRRRSAAVARRRSGSTPAPTRDTSSPPGSCLAPTAESRSPCTPAGRSAGWSPTTSPEHAVPESPRVSANRSRPGLLLIPLIVAWAVAWPVIKLGVSAVPPIWYACLRYGIATVCLFGVAARQGLVWPSAPDRRLVAVSGTLQMAAYLRPHRARVDSASARPRLCARVFHAALGRSARGLAAGRAHPAPRRIGVALGLGGVLAIAAPALRADGAGGRLAYALLLAASAAWAISIVWVRAHRFGAPALALAPWRDAGRRGAPGSAGVDVEGRLPPIGGPGCASLAYVGPVATAFAYWAVVEAGRRYPRAPWRWPLSATPALGLMISRSRWGNRWTPRSCWGSCWSAPASGSRPWRVCGRVPSPFRSMSFAARFTSQVEIQRSACLTRRHLQGSPSSTAVRGAALSAAPLGSLLLGDVNA